jgi:hypothetical protein
MKVWHQVCTSGIRDGLIRFGSHGTTVMVRLGVVTYLAFATAAWPTLCCCTIARMFAFCSQSASSATPDASSHHPCCPDHRSTNVPQNHSGPCQGKRVALAVFDADDTSDWLLRTYAGQASVAKSVQLASLIHTRMQECIAFPFHHSRDILAALQILRC